MTQHFLAFFFRTNTSLGLFFQDRRADSGGIFAGQGPCALTRAMLLRMLIEPAGPCVGFAFGFAIFCTLYGIRVVS